MAKATAEMKPRKRSPPTALARWIAAMFEPPLIAAIALLALQHRGIEEVGIGRDQRDGAEADDERQDVEIADEAGGVEHRLARGLGVGTVKKRIRICGRPAVPNISARPSDTADDRIGDQLPGSMIASASDGPRPPWRTAPRAEAESSAPAAP